MMNKFKSLLTLPLLLTLMGSACTQGSEPNGRPIVSRGALERDVYESTVMQDPGTGITREELERYAQIFENFEASAPAILASDEMGERLESIERVYMSSGRYLELVAMYRKSTDERGMARGAAPIRLAWAMVRLGQDRESRELVEQLLKVRPANPDVWFLLGAIWIKEASGSKDAAERVVMAWRKVLQLDADYVGFEGISAQTLRRELERFAPTVQLSPEDAQAMEASYTQPAKPAQEAPVEQPAEPASADASPAP